MSKLKIKFYIVTVLLFISVILFIIKISLPGKETSSFTNISTKKYSDTSEAKKYFSGDIDSILKSYGIRSDWIKTNQSSISFPFFFKEVQITADISANEIVSELSDFISYNGFLCTAVEEFKSGNIDLIINFNDKKSPLAGISFTYNYNLKRVAPEICIVFTGFDKYILSECQSILGSDEKFSVVLPDNMERSDIQAAIIDSKRDYILMFTVGDEDDLNADFRKKDRDWRTKFYSICSDYEREKPVLIKSIGNDKEFANELITEFKKCKDFVFSDSLLTIFDSKESGEEKVEEFFSKILNEFASGKMNFYFLIKFDNKEMEYYLNKVSSFEKRGFHFRTFTEMIKKNKN